MTVNNRTFDSRSRYVRAGKGSWVALALLAFLGAFFAGYKLRPRLTAENFLAIYAKYVGELPSHKHPVDKPIPEIGANDYRRLIRLHSLDDVAARRAEAMAYVWRGRPIAYHDLRPEQVERDTFFPPLAEFGTKASMDRLRVELPFGVVSEILHIRPVQPRSCLMLYHEGHHLSFVARKRFLKRMLDEGCDVLAFSLPLSGPINNRPTIDHPRFGRILLNDPDDLQYLDSAAHSSLYYFVAPIAAGLNHVLAERSFERVGATGFSGGGWAVTLAAALDPRIQFSYAVAGSAPIGVHAARPSWGSPEQRDARFYEIAPYTELYTMAAAGAGRRHLQFFNRTDPCCFSGTEWLAYGEAVRERAVSMDGEFRLLTYAAEEHRLSKPVALAIVDDFLNGGHAMPKEIERRY